MAETTNIQWTDATVNPWWGCTKVSLGCKRHSNRAIIQTCVHVSRTITGKVAGRFPLMGTCLFGLGSNTTLQMSAVAPMSIALLLNSILDAGLLRGKSFTIATESRPTIDLKIWKLFLGQQSTSTGTGSNRAISASRAKKTRSLSVHVVAAKPSESSIVQIGQESMSLATTQWRPQLSPQFLLLWLLAHCLELRSSRGLGWALHPLQPVFPSSGLRVWFAKFGMECGA